jgi:hypothetical protein
MRPKAAAGRRVSLLLGTVDGGATDPRRPAAAVRSLAFSSLGCPRAIDPRISALADRPAECKDGACGHKRCTRERRSRQMDIHLCRAWRIGDFGCFRRLRRLKHPKSPPDARCATYARMHSTRHSHGTAVGDSRILVLSARLVSRWLGHSRRLSNRVAPLRNPTMPDTVDLRACACLSCEGCKGEVSNMWR